MARIIVYATTSGALPQDSDLFPSEKYHLTIITANDGSARLLIEIRNKLNNAGAVGSPSVDPPLEKRYSSFVEFLQEWTKIEVVDEVNHKAIF